MKSFRPVIIVVLIVAFGTGLLLGYLTVAFGMPKSVGSQAMASCDSVYRFINPLLACDITSPSEKKEYKAFRVGLEEAIIQWKKEGKASHVSVYFRDLDNGPTFGVNEDEKFSPASLLKVPVMLAYYKYAEQDPDILTTKISVGEVEKTNQIIPKEQAIESGSTYTVEELLEKMIIYSDNRSKNELVAYINTKIAGGSYLLRTLIELGLVETEVQIDDVLSVKTYASLFRLLYNVSYLSIEYSEKALELLSRIDFKDGILVGVPDDVKVAHKFGIRDQADGQKQLHDCGVVYHPQNNYLLCVMTRGKEGKSLSWVIGEVSRRVYEEVDSRNTE